MPTEHLLSILVGIALMLLVLRIAVWPEVRNAMVMRSGLKGTAIVRAMELTAVMNDKKRYLHKVELEVHLEGVPPYAVTVTQFLPWFHGNGQGMEGRELEVRVHVRKPGWVAILGPKRVLPD